MGFAKLADVLYQLLNAPFFQNHPEIDRNVFSVWTWYKGVGILNLASLILEALQFTLIRGSHLCLYKIGM